MSILESHWLEEQRKDFITKENRPLRWGKATEWKKTRMNKEDKIQELAEKIEQLTKELEELSRNREVECYGDTLIDSDTGQAKEAFKMVGPYNLQCYSSYKEEIGVHNCYKPDQDLSQQINYQRIINRMWQLAYELNPDGWDWENLVNSGYEVYDLSYDFENSTWTWYYIDQWADGVSVHPKFASKEAAQKAADDLNSKGYKL
jgi:hypothetical protein